jgi:3-ketosteroid 9alpha-monooxygenase subunit B
MTTQSMLGYVTEAFQETMDTWTLHITIVDGHLEYRSGQSIQIDPKQFPEINHWCKYLEKVKGRPEKDRLYSVSSMPDDEQLMITVKAEPYDPEKHEYPPLLSPLLASSALEGAALHFNGYFGDYVLPTDAELFCDQVLHVCGGSGIVPNYSMLRGELEGNRNPSLKHTLLYVNQNNEEVIFKEALRSLEDEFDNFEVVYHATRSTPLGSPEYPFTESFLESLTPHPENTLVYICGPHRLGQYDQSFGEGVKEVLLNLGVHNEKIKINRY